MLIAKRPILYLNRMYESGEELPTYDKRLVKAWLESGSAKETEEAAPAEEAPAAPAEEIQTAPAEAPEEKPSTKKAAKKNSLIPTGKPVGLSNNPE